MSEATEATTGKVTRSFDSLHGLASAIEAAWQLDLRDVTVTSVLGTNGKLRYVLDLSRPGLPARSLQSTRTGT